MPILNRRSFRHRAAVSWVLRAFILCSPVTASLVIAGVTAGNAHAQEPERTAALQPELVAELDKLREAAMSSDYAWRQVAHLTENIGPRIDGSPQADQAVEYVAAEMRRLGLDVKLEKVTVPHWVRGEERGALTRFPGQAPGTTQKIVLAALGQSAATAPAGITAEVVVVNNFDELAALGREKVSGRIVLYNEKFDKRMAAQGETFEAYDRAVIYRSRGPAAAKALGAIASLVRSVESADYRLPHTGYSGPAGIPAAAVTAEDADLIADLAHQGRVEMNLVLTPQTLPPAVSYNVIADLKGSEHPEQIVVVSGHLDSWDLGTGATDDAAGVAVAMQVANLCKQLGLHPKRTLRVIAWMDEESGSSGSAAYAAEYAADLANHVGAIESDSGAGHPLGFLGPISAAEIDALQPVAKILAKFGADLFKPGREAAGDIAILAKSGVPTFGLNQDTRHYMDYHHSAADTLDKIHPQELAENAAAMAILAYALTNMPSTLPR